MKNHFLQLSLLACFLMLFSFAFSQNVSLPASGGNEKASVTQNMGLASVTINYSSPDVHAPNGTDRRGQIWGQLVPFGLNNLGFGTSTAAPWRAGANENTTFTFSHDVNIQGKKLKAGTYGFHIIVQDEGKPWTLIFSHNSTAWGSFFYDEKEDALRVDATPEKGAYTEWLTYGFENRQPTSCTAYLQWEEKKLPFTIEVPNMTDLYVAIMRKELQSTAGFSPQGWATAATYCANNNVNLEEALVWADNAISMPFVGQKTFNNLTTKAAVLRALKRDDEANKVMDEAIRMPGATVFQIHGYGRQLLTQGKKDEAMKVFQYNAETFPNTWPVNVGLARGYSALGEYKKALKHAKLAQANVPAGDQLNTGSVASMIEKLGKGEDIN